MTWSLVFDVLILLALLVLLTGGGIFGKAILTARRIRTEETPDSSTSLTTQEEQDS